jgi:hypothetical protein
MDYRQAKCSTEIGAPLLSTEKIFDGTKLRLEGSRPETTTYGMKSTLSPVFDHSESATLAACPPEPAQNDTDGLNSSAMV